jgi:hypothetical protein
MLPTVAKVIFIHRAVARSQEVPHDRHFPTRQKCGRIFEIIRVGDSDLIGLAALAIHHAESMKMAVEPPHGILDGDMKVPEAVTRGHLDPSPNEWLDVTEVDLEPKSFPLSIHCHFQDRTAH